MDDKEFERLAGEALAAIEAALENNDIDYEMLAGGVLEIDLARGGKLVINRHAPLREIWLAGRCGAFHFSHDGKVWRDTRGGGELLTSLSRLISELSGQEFRL
ncbi:MAG: cyaY [Proteobacteria bacterium]|nr:cyaY [Pseudomonadota bacterium]